MIARAFSMAVNGLSAGSACTSSTPAVGRPSCSGDWLLIREIDFGWSTLSIRGLRLVAPASQQVARGDHSSSRTSRTRFAANNPLAGRVEADPDDWILPFVQR